MKPSYRLTIASSALCSGLLLTSVASAQQYILFGDGYVPKPHDTYVPADAGACCIGEASNFTNVYLAQTFKATGRRPESILLGLVSNIGEPFRFRLLFTEVEAGFHPGEILWESRDLVLPAADTMFTEYSFRIPGSLRFDVGTQYAFIFDTYVTRDGVPDLGGFFSNIGHDVPPYLDGVRYFADATGLGREADFASNWITDGFDVSFLIRYRDDRRVPEPISLALVGVGLAALAITRRRKQQSADHARVPVLGRKPGRFIERLKHLHGMVGRARPSKKYASSTMAQVSCLQ